MKRLIALLILGVSLMATQVKADGLRLGYIKTHDGEKIHYVRKGTGTPLILQRRSRPFSNIVYFFTIMGLDIA